MQRLIIEQLMQWKRSDYRKPLIVQGVRQVGKTWILREFGARCYEHVAYFNFEENEDFRQFFKLSKDPHRILQNLRIASNQIINADNTLIIFDEIQDCPELITSLKYFYENAPEYHVVCAGSLLGIALAKPLSFPVGKVNMMCMYPMTFTEFLLANNQSNLVEYLEQLNKINPIPDTFFKLLLEYLKMYYVTGGMPEPVCRWVTDHNVQTMHHALEELVKTYEFDFLKHISPIQYPKISLIWNSLPSQLARENKKFLYKAVKQGARAREYEDALQWLVNAQLVYKVYRSTAPRIPLCSYDDSSAFKIYLADVGILRCLSHLDIQAFTEGNRLFTEFKGAFSENYVAQALIAQTHSTLHYWSQTNPPYEVDFLLQYKNDIFPVEVKADTNITSKSLKKFKELFPQYAKLRIRFSLNNLSLDGDVLNIPLFMADFTPHVLECALAQLGRRE